VVVVPETPGGRQPGCHGEPEGKGCPCWRLVDGKVWRVLLVWARVELVVNGDGEQLCDGGLMVKEKGDE
jgi:hypothetical protein